MARPSSDPERIQGELEIDHDRGVVYFHAHDRDVADKYGTPTILRLKSPIKILHNAQIDVFVSPTDAAIRELGLTRSEVGHE